jgi:hypothetical protein
MAIISPITTMAIISPITTSLAAAAAATATFAAATATAVAFAAFTTAAFPTFPKVLAVVDHCGRVLFVDAVLGEPPQDD